VITPHSYWYVGTPYSRYEAGLQSAYEDACRQTARLMRERVPVYCPIAHSHGIAIHGGLDPVNGIFWSNANYPLMLPAVGLLVVEMAGWRDSEGLELEIQYFKDLHRPVISIVPGWQSLPVKLQQWMIRHPDD
jgi:hypothetical protein